MTTRMMHVALPLAAIACAAVAAYSGETADAAGLTARLQARLDALTALRGRFVQTLDSPSLGRPRTESGTFAIRKPSSMRWEYRDPEVKLAITDGTDTWLYLPEDREVQIGTLAQQEGATAAMLLTGRTRLDRDFRARRLDPAGAGTAGMADPGGSLLELTPLRPVEEYDRLIVTVDPDRLLVRRLTIVDPLGGRMSFEFDDLEENPALPEDLFRFEIPSGVDVIDQRAKPATRD